MSNYSYLASFYDSLTGNVDYNRRADFVVERFEPNVTGVSILDAGCGSGTFSHILIEKGFDVIGIDNSPEMLALAREKNPDQLLICQDLVCLDLYGTVMGIVCLQDTLNHLQDLKSVKTALQKFSLFLEKDGYLFFDINTFYKHSVVLGNNSFILENDDVLCAWRNHFNTSDDSVVMQLDLFIPQSNDIYQRETEVIREIFISLDWVKKTLVELGFSIDRIIDGDSYEDPSEKTERLLVIAKKL